MAGLSMVDTGGLAANDKATWNASRDAERSASRTTRLVVAAAAAAAAAGISFLPTSWSIGHAGSELSSVLSSAILLGARTCTYGWGSTSDGARLIKG